MKKLKYLAGFILASATAGALVTVPVGIAGVVGVQAAEPVVMTWKETPEELPEIAIAEHNFIKDREGNVIAELWEQDRVQLESIDEVGDNVITALIDTEDKNFYSHKGFDPQGTMRAALKRKGGGSGITQQLVKNLQYYNLLDTTPKADATEKSYSRKVRELRLAMNYEKNHTKDEILLKYLNTISFGSPSIYGIQTASKYFFDKDSKDLTMAEAAALVGTIKNPTKYNMKKEENFDVWKQRQSVVLSRVLDEGHITREEYEAYKKENLNLKMISSTSRGCAVSSYPFYCSYVMDELSKDGRMGTTQEDREARIARGGIVVNTYMEADVMDKIDSYMEANWGNGNRLIAPTAIVEPGTGGVVGMGANRNYGTGEGNTMITLPTSASGTGSTYKMITLAAALESGMKESDLAFSSECPLYPGKKYDAPKGGFRNSNSCALQGGYMDYKYATAFSSNTWFVTLEKKIGVETVKDFSRSVGLSAPDNITSRSLSYTLGPTGNSPIDMAAAFATFANGGVYCKPTPIEAIRDLNDNPIQTPDDYDPNDNACRGVMSEKNAGIVLKAMSGSVSGEFPGSFNAKYGLRDRDNGGKSGTNENLNSAWAHITAQQSLFTNVYDMDKTVRGVKGGKFKGRGIVGGQNAAEITGYEIIKDTISKHEPRPLKFVSNDTTKKDPLPNYQAFDSIPDLSGMTPEAATAVMEARGIDLVVSYERGERPNDMFPAGVIVSQDIEPGKMVTAEIDRVITVKISD